MLRLRPSKYRIIAGLLAVVLVVGLLKLFGADIHHPADLSARASHDLR